MNYNLFFKKYKIHLFLDLKKEELFKILAKSKLTKLFPLPHMFDSTVVLGEINVNSIHIFKSAQMPVKLTFSCTDIEEELVVIYKYGDDIRQDEFCLNLIQFINELWIKNGLDLNIVTYKILPTGNCQCFIEFIDSHSLSSILELNENSVLKYIRSLVESNNEHFDLIQERFVKSCAGYAAISYLLGVGDRHLENLMLDGKGRLFHIDYAYIFGNDPKPMPPPFKLTAEMIEAMNGIDDENFSIFMSLLCGALGILRENYENLFNFIDAFKYSELDDFFDTSQQLRQSIQNATYQWIKIINNSTNAFIPQLIDTFHKWAQDWRE